MLPPKSTSFHLLVPPVLVIAKSNTPTGEHTRVHHRPEHNSLAPTSSSSSRVIPANPIIVSSTKPRQPQQTNDPLQQHTRDHTIYPSNRDPADVLLDGNQLSGNILSSLGFMKNLMVLDVLIVPVKWVCTKEPQQPCKCPRAVLVKQSTD
ncbi:unnamed protein product [Camellia sinensis]